MPLNISVKKADAYTAFARKDLVFLAELPAGPGQLPLKEPIVQIIDAEGVTPRVVRRVEWVLDAAVTYTDDHSDEDAVKATLETIVQNAPNAVATIGGLPNPQAIIDSTFNVYRSLKRIWSDKRGYVMLSVRDLPVHFDDRAGAILRLRATLEIDALWMTDDPDDSGNRAWFEMESLKIDPPGAACRVAGKFDVNAKTDLAGSGSGRTWFVPTQDTDMVGVFPEKIGDCTRDVNADDARVSFDVSLTVTASNTTSVVIRKLVLKLEILPPEEPRTRRDDKGGKPEKPEKSAKPAKKKSP